MEETPRLFVATKGFICHNGNVLIIRESQQYVDGVHAGLFDVVGGRMTPGERFDNSLRREAKEETGLDVRVGAPFFVGEWRPRVKGELWQVVGIFFECLADTDQVALSSDHSDYKWIEPAAFSQENLIPRLNLAFEAYLHKIRTPQSMDLLTPVSG